MSYSKLKDRKRLHSITDTLNHKNITPKDLLINTLSYQSDTA